LGITGQLVDRSQRWWIERKSMRTGGVGFGIALHFG